jgi:hypothetical protein
MGVLRTLRDVLGASYFVSGGFVRNKVWDIQHGFTRATPLDDVDIIYYDSADSSRSHDRALEATLSAKRSDVPWSVKNQARMHLVTGDEPYISLEDALVKWPDTATAVAVNLDHDGQIGILAPHGFTDLLNLIVRPTPHFYSHPLRYEQRLREKMWHRTWPKLRITHLMPTSEPAA